MRLQAITMIAIVTGLVGSTTVEANDLFKAINTIDHVVNGPKFGGPKIGGPKFGPKPIVKPHPGHGHLPPKPPACKPKPPVYKPPVKLCPVCHHKHCTCQKPPINKPPMKKFTMKLLNNADTKLFFSINGLDYQLLEADGVELVKSLSPKSHRIAFHNGIEVVEFDLDPTAIYSFEWEENQLMLYEIEG